MFPLHIHFYCCPPLHSYLHSSKYYVETDNSIRGLVKSLAFCINLAWCSFHKSFTVTTEDLFCSRSTYSYRTKLSSDRWCEASFLFCSFSFNVLKAIAFFTQVGLFLCRDTRSGYTFPSNALPSPYFSSYFLTVPLVFLSIFSHSHISTVCPLSKTSFLII